MRINKIRGPFILYYHLHHLIQPEEILKHRSMKSHIFSAVFRARKQVSPFGTSNLLRPVQQKSDILIIFAGFQSLQVYSLHLPI